MSEPNRTHPRSAAASARYNVTCPKCGAGPQEPCRTEKSGRVTDTHLARIMRNEL